MQEKYSVDQRLEIKRVLVNTGSNIVYNVNSPFRNEEGTGVETRSAVVSGIVNGDVSVSQPRSQGSP